MYIGKCSLCGGDVDLPDNWLGTQRARAPCVKCHAVSVDDFGKTIAMERPDSERREAKRRFDSYVSARDQERITPQWPWMD